MRMRGIQRLRRATRRLRHRFGRQAIILLYHRVAEVHPDPWALCVTPRHFAEHLEVLRRYGFAMALQQLAQRLQHDTLPRRSVIITLDDGYADNLHQAKPLLERYGIPATVFLTTGSMDDGREFWWDEVARLLLEPGGLPKTLRLTINGSARQWELGEAAHYREEASWCHRDWRAWDKDVPSSRHALYRSLYILLRSLPEGERRKVLDDLLAWAESEPAVRASHRPLSPEEVLALRQGELIEVGSHTVSHPDLSILPVAAQRDEIQRSKARLEEVLGHAVRSFAYPYGFCTSETVALVRTASFACACSGSGKEIWRNTDPFQLPRVMVHDWDGEEFARRLLSRFEE